MIREYYVRYIEYNINHGILIKYVRDENGNSAAVVISPTLRKFKISSRDLIDINFAKNLSDTDLTEEQALELCDKWGLKEVFLAHDEEQERIAIKMRHNDNYFFEV